MPYVIKKATIGDIKGIASLHKEQFRDHFLGHYPIFIIEKFYESFLDTPLFFAALRENNVVGFVMGGDSAKLQTCKKNFIKKNLLMILLSTICIPSLYIDALYRVKQMKNKPIEKKVQTSSSKSIRLLSIAVSKEMQGTDLASTLVSTFEQHLEGVLQYGLSVKDTNKRVINFYKKMGFQLEKEENHSFYLIKKLS